MDKYKISIIVPVYNVEKYINKCLDSIINQTYKNLEILLIDDGSTDNSGIICDEYAKKDKRIVVYHQPNSGVSAARNKGLDNITGDYVMFVDPDDWIELNACEILLKEIQKDNNEILFFNFYREYENQSKKNDNFIFDSDDKEINHKLQAKILAPSITIPSFNVQHIGFTWNKIISTKYISNLRFPFEGKQAIFEDGLFYYNLLETNIKPKIKNEFLYHYRILNNSLTKRFNKDFITICDEIFKNINKKSLNHKEDIYFEKSLSIRAIINFYNSLIVYYNNSNYKKNKIERVKAIKKELKKDYYQKYIKKVKIRDLSKKLKIYAILLKTKAYFCLLLVNDIEKNLRKVVRMK